MKIDWTDPNVKVVMKSVPLREPTWWEKGPVRYGALSFSLWTRHVYYDVRGKKPAKK